MTRKNGVAYQALQLPPLTLTGVQRSPLARARRGGWGRCYVFPKFTIPEAITFLDHSESQLQNAPHGPDEAKGEGLVFTRMRI